MEVESHTLSPLTHSYHGRFGCSRLAKPVVPIALSARSRVGTRCIVSAGDGCIVGDGNGCIAEVSLLLSSSSLSPSLVLAPRLVSSPLVS